MIFEAMGVQMYYEVHGEAGRPLLLLHGWGGKCESFLPVTRDFQDTHRIYVVDFPGHGRSSEPPEPWSATEYAEMIARFIEQMDIAGCDVLGHSHGGRVTLALASSRPELVGRLILTGCAGLPPKYTAQQNSRSSRYQQLKKLIHSAPVRMIFGEKRIDRWQEALIQKYGSSDYKALTPSMRATFNKVLRQDMTGCLPKIKASTLLVWGEDDTATPLWMGQEMEKQIPDAGLVTLPGCGHFAYLDKYPEFKAIMRSFIG
ncbi:MAG: alpha/beta hydrolase [Clostridia bacterium]|nr:alpha/beta hydrolase [Clostridia bacterium]